MKICIIGKGLTALILAKKLVELGIKIDLIDEKEIHFFRIQEHWLLQKKILNF